MSNPDAPKVVLVPMTYTEAAAMLLALVADLPHPLPYNVRHEQWDLMLPNLEAVEARVWKAKRLLAAISEHNQPA